MRVTLLMRLWSLFFFLLTLFSVTASERIPTKVVSIDYDKFKKMVKQELSPLFHKYIDEWFKSLPSTSANPTDIIKSGENINLKLPLHGDLDKFIRGLVIDKYQDSTFKYFLDKIFHSIT